MMGRRRRGWFRRDAGGATAVEFALILPVLLTFLLGLIEFGRAMWIRNTMQYAVEDAARYAAITSGATSSDVTTFAQSRLLALDSATVTFSVTFGASSVTVSATHSFQFLASGLLPFGPITLSASAQFPM